MSRIINAEFRKVFCKKLVWIVLAAVFVANGVLFVFQQYQERSYELAYWDDLLSAEQQYQSMPFSEAYARLKQQNEDYTTITSYRMLSLDEGVSLSDQLQEEYRQAMERMKGDPSLEDEQQFSRKSFVVSALYRQAEYMAGYPAYIDGMEERARQMQSVSIFQKPNSFSYRNTVKTPQDFEHLKGIPLSFGNSNGFQALHQFAVTDLFVLAFAFLLCIYLFLQEKENGLLSMVKATPGGGARTMAAKLIVLVSCTILMASLVYGGNLALSGWIYGFGDLSRTVQSMSLFRDCNILLTAGQWLLLFWGSKVAAVLLCVLMFSLVFTLFENNKGIYLVLLLLLAVSWACWSWIMPLSALNFFKYVNLFSFLDPFSLFCEYTNINLFEYPVSLVPVCLLSAGMIAVLLVLAMLLFFVRRKGTGITIPTFWRRSQRKKIRGTARLWLAEGRKLLVTEKVWILLALALLVAWLQVDTTPLKMNYEDAVYKQYAISYAGALTEQSDLAIAQEEKKFAGISNQIQELEEKYSNGQITLEEKEKEIYKLTQFSEKEKGFQRFLSQYRMLQQKKEQGYRVAVIDQLSSDQLFDQPQRDLLQAMLYCVFLILALCNLFPIDMKKRLDGLIHATNRGGYPLLRVRHCYSWILAVLFALILYLPIAVNFQAKYEISDWSAAIQSIKQFQNITMFISIRGFVLMGGFVFLFGVFSLSLLVLFLSQLCRKQAICVILSTLVLFCPLLLPSIGISTVNLFCFNNVFYFYTSAVWSGMGAQIFYLIAMAALSMALWLANRAWFVLRRSDW